ncbi:Crp/Fnr family transcriptional regulator [Chromohalobacter israelensis]|uniref:Crp/Fnr family transcriptional regulator n=1 Tax=Chromohalobacter israelensis TaxID=141390 RepID=UPI000FFEE27A|nr:Crp/Fnr family transcriptional regulator [Chromohalobacter salexigens]RXE47042.1 hypothetical protein B4O83_03125 [Chromohalobacter salexigens]
MSSLNAKSSRKEALEHPSNGKNQPLGYSIFFHVLSQHKSLTRRDRETLQFLQGAPRRVRKGEIIKSESCNTNSLLAIQDGWACSYRLTNEGERQIIDLYLPGDIVGLRGYHKNGKSDKVVMLTEGLVTPALESKIDKAIEENPRLMHAFLATAMYQSDVMADRLNNLITHDAPTRIAYFILEVQARLNLTKASTKNVHLPLSQKVVGELLGMTNVHVCRCLYHLESLGLISREKENREIKILSHEGLIDLSGFNNSHAYSNLPVHKGDTH